MADTDQNGRRDHIVLVPGFVGFDALGQLMYYVGVTQLFEEWASQHKPSHGLTVHYVDSFPTASVTLRAQRLVGYLVSRVTRGEFAPGDRIALVGHSTGGLDIRKALWELTQHAEGEITVDGGLPVRHAELLEMITHLAFVSVPHYGTNLADFFWGLGDTLQAVVKDAGLAVQLNRAPISTLRRLLSVPLSNTKSDLLLAIADALNESDEDPKGAPIDRAGEREARSQLALWLEHMGKDLGILADLRSDTGRIVHSGSPAHFTPQQRTAELQSWRTHGISTVSYVSWVPKPDSQRPLNALFDHAFTVAPILNMFAGVLNRSAEQWWNQFLSAPAVVLRSIIPALTLPGAVALLDRDPAAIFDLFYHLCASPKGHFRDAAAQRQASLVPEVIDLLSGQRHARESFDTQDSDGVVNTLSMLWPYEPHDPERHPHYRLVADHGDIIGHYKRSEKAHSSQAGRQYVSYDIFPSGSGFGAGLFARVWTHLFDSCVTAMSDDKTQTRTANVAVR